MSSAHFVTATGITYPRNGFPCGGYRPDFVSEINFRPAGETKFTGGDEHMYRQQDGKPGQFTPLSN